MSAEHPAATSGRIVPFRKYIAELPKPVTIMLGMDWKEQHRLDKPRKAYEALGYQVAYLLMWQLRPYQGCDEQGGQETTYCTDKFTAALVPLCSPGVTWGPM